MSTESIFVVVWFYITDRLSNRYDMTQHHTTWSHDTTPYDMTQHKNRIYFFKYLIKKILFWKFKFGFKYRNLIISSTTFRKGMIKKHSVKKKFSNFFCVFLCRVMSYRHVIYKTHVSCHIDTTRHIWTV